LPCQLEHVGIAFTWVYFKVRLGKEFG
jgi:hypothetical protein